MKDFNRFMFHKRKNKNKKWFCKNCLQGFSSENILIKHKESCLNINGKQSVKLAKGVSFKIYADFECNLKSVKCNAGFYTEKYQDHIPCNFAYSIVCINNRFSKPTVIYRGENAAYEIIKAILKEYKYCKKITRKTF